MQKNQSTILRWIAPALASFAMLYALIMHLESSYTNIRQELMMWLPALAGLILFFRHAFHRALSRRGQAVSLCLGAVFAAFCMVGDEILSTGTIERLVDKRYLVSTAVRFAGWWTGLYALLRTVYSACLNAKPQTRKPLSFMKCWLVILLCWVPYFIAFYPGVLSVDSFHELQSILGIDPLNNRHPLIHQVILLPFLKAGEAISSLTLGVALYTLFQMAVLSGVFALTLRQMDRRGAPRWLICASFVWYAVYTVNAMYSVTVWKDVSFGCITLLLLLMLWEAAERPSVKGKRGLWLAMPVVMFLFCTLRNNGFYVFVAALPFFLLMVKQNRGRFLLAAAGGLLLYAAWQVIMLGVLDVQNFSTGEMLSVPLQQLARTLDSSTNRLTEQELSVLQEIFPDLEKAAQSYNPLISDAVKSAETFSAETFNQDPVKYLLLWAKIGLKHPIIYLDAFFNQNFGYWYPNLVHGPAFFWMAENPFGMSYAPATAGLRSALYNLNQLCQNAAGTSALYSIASYVWVHLAAAGMLLVKKQRSALAICLIPLFMWGIIVVSSPVFAEYRYLYGLIVSTPLVAGMAVCLSEKK